MHLSPKRITQLTTIAVFLLKSKNPEAINSLKDFLTIVPNQEKVQEIIITAINQIMETDPETIYWLLKNPSYLQPEIDIRVIVTQALNQKFINWGFMPEDIHFNNDGNLEVNAEIKDQLIKDQLIKDQLIKDQLIKDQLIKDQLIKDQLVKDQLIKDQLVKADYSENDIALMNLIHLFLTGVI